MIRANQTLLHPNSFNRALQQDNWPTLRNPPEPVTFAIDIDHLICKRWHRATGPWYWTITTWWETGRWQPWPLFSPVSRSGSCQRPGREETTGSRSRLVLKHIFLIVRRRIKGANPVDVCPFIWKELEQLGYVTSWNEDSPSTGTFTYRYLAIGHNTFNTPYQQSTRRKFTGSFIFQANWVHKPANISLHETILSGDGATWTK